MLERRVAYVALVAIFGAAAVYATVTGQPVEGIAWGVIAVANAMLAPEGRGRL